MKRKQLFDILPSELKIKIYKYDYTYKYIFNLVIEELINYNIKKKLKKILNPYPFILKFL